MKIALYTLLFCLFTLSNAAFAQYSGPCDTISMPDTLKFCTDTTIVLPNTISGPDSIVSFSWSPSVGISDTTIQHPHLYVSHSGWYYLTTTALLPPNLVVNGDFSAGSTGFSTGYTVEGYGSTSTPGYYAVDTNPFLYDGAWPVMGDHTTGTGKMLIVDGAYSSSTDFWCESVPVTTGTNYLFTVWIALLHDPLPDIRLTINGASTATFTLSSVSGVWEQYTIAWNSGIATSANMCMYDNSTGGYGNDFAVDDISFQQLCTARDSLFISVAVTDTTYMRLDTSLCINEGIPVVINAPARYTSYLWSTGSTNSSIPVDSGKYFVFAYKGCGVLVDSIHISLLQDTVILRFDTSACITPGETILINAPAGYTYYLWSNGSTNVSLSATNGVYYVSASESCHLLIDTVHVTLVNIPVVNLGPDTVICGGAKMLITVTEPAGTTFLWNTGSTGSSLSIDTSGTYALTVSQNGCSSSDSLLVQQLTAPKVNLGADTFLCQGEQIVLVATLPGAEWSTGATSPTLTVTTAGTYWVKESNQCGESVDTINVDVGICDIWFPSAFSPDGDGHNDIIRVVGNLGRYTDYSLGIYNRWGQRVFYTTDIYAGWNGRFNGVQQDANTYFYLINYTLENKKHMMKGDFELIR